MRAFSFAALTSLGASPFNYAAIAWGLDVEGDNRAAAVIPGTASTGTSGSNYLRSTAAETIAAGATYNGRASYANASDAIWSAGAPNNWNLDKIVSADGKAFTFFAVVKITAFPAVGTRFDNVYRLLGTQTSAYWGIGVYNDGANNRILAGFYDGNVGSYRNVSAICPLATLVVIAFQLTAGTLRVRVGSGAWQTLSVTASGYVGSLANYLTNYDASDQRAAADVCRLSCAPSALTDAQIDAAMAWLAARYGAAL